VSTVYEIGPFCLDPEAGVLSRGGHPMALGSRAVAVLAALVKQPNEYVRKERIFDAAWSGVVVEESNLAVQIFSIRRALAQASGGEHWIETLARRGYRFVGPVTELTSDRRQDIRGGSKKTNLPEPLTSFIGRERELVEIKRLLPGKRLVTLVGVGGIGKTRLALQVAAEVMAAYRDGVWLVDLAPLSDPTLVQGTVAQVLGVREAVGKSLIETMCSQVTGRQLLLLLDNCEHLLKASASLAEAILRSAAELTIIATSREPLHVGGEQTYPLAALTLPGPTADAATVARSEAVQLFVERARRQQPHFELTAANIATVAQLCVHLDGIPLALELAAARAHSLSIAQINAHLDDRFKLLTGGDRTALPRHQTLRATFDWSYDLLSVHERAVLMRLAVFAGGFTLEAASAVTSDEAIDEFAVIDLVSQLVERSLVVADISDAGARYRLLETTRAYALERLADGGESNARRRRHAEYFRGLFEHAPDDWLRMPDVEWRAIYVPERDDVRAALDWALGSNGDPVIGIALAGASGALWSTLGLFGEGVQRLEAAVARVESHTSRSDQARLWLWLGRLMDEAPAQAQPAFERATELYRRLGDASGLGQALVRLGRILAFMGRVEQSAAVLTEAYTLLERVGPPRLLGYYFSNLGFLKMLSGDLVSARRHYEQALALYRETGAEYAVLAALGSLSEVTWALGDLDATVATFRQRLAILRDSPMSTNRLLGFALINLTGVLNECGELDEALAAAREGLPLLREEGYAWLFGDHVGLRAALAGKLANAARLAAYADSAYAGNAAARQPNEVRARKRLQALLHEKLAPDEVQRLFAEGAKMNEDEACRRALEE
jgi:predicted ATPase/DNA-binding winged helix-turn-helix (wHTH) protein